MAHNENDTVLITSHYYLLFPGAKLRLLARLARLESRSPVTSLLADADTGTPLPLTMGDITEAAMMTTLEMSGQRMLEAHLDY